MKKAVLPAVIALFVSGLFAQAPSTGFDLTNYGVRIEPDKRVMTVLAALDAARTTDEKGEPVPVLHVQLSPEGIKFREQIRSDLAHLHDDLRRRISSFVIHHKKRNSKLSDAEIAGQFISMAYALSPTPDLADPVLTNDLPGSVLDVLDFAPLVREFYRRSSFSGNVNEYVKAYQKISDGRLRSSSREMVSDLLGYLQTRPQIFIAERVKTETQKSGSKSTTLKSTETRERERRFVIVPEMLAPNGYVHFVNIKDDYYVILPGDSDVTFSEVRRAFLQFVVDPIVLKNAKDIVSITPAVKALLDQRRKLQPDVSPDVYLTIARSLVAAIDARQAESVKVRYATEQARTRITQLGGKDPTGRVAAELQRFKQEQSDETVLRLSEEYEKGAILAFYFADQLKGIEESGTDIAASFSEMILSFDPAKESNRYERHVEARTRAIAAREERKKKAAGPSIVENPVTARLIEVQKAIDAKNFAQASAELSRLLTDNPNEPRIHYNMGRVAGLLAAVTDDAEQQSAKLLEAKKAYERVIEISQKQRVDPALVSLAYVALGRIYEFNDQKSYAMAIYDAAIRIGDVPGGGYQEALAAKTRLIKNR